ncbi:hypothetical protein [Microbispora sp. NPDC049125]|uniref:hypothetical protein n=1 Tax=Microbispora sp. NPDC049125 TaxID=3154929 RepID=UPI0034668745
MTGGRAQELAVKRHDVEEWLRAGEHALFVEGDLAAGRHWFDAAYREAERRGDGETMARAALGLGGLWVHEHRTAADAAKVRTRQRRAVQLVDPRSSVALRLRIRMAAEDDYRTGGHGAILAAVAEARDSGDPVALAEALSLAHHCVLGPEHGPLRRELAQELIGESSRTGRRSDLLMGLLWRTVDLFADDDPHAERSLAELSGLLVHDDHLAAGFVVSAIEVMLGIRAGLFDRAEAAASVCAERGAAAGDVDTTGWYGGQLATIRWYQGRVAELLPLLSELVNSPTLSSIDNSYFSGLAVAAATAGDRRQAAGALARLRGRSLADLPRSSSWLITMYGVVEAAYMLEDAEIAAEAHALLAPFARLPVIVSLGVACFGSVHHSLGMASLTVGDLDGAVEHLRAAVRHNLSLGHWPAVVLSRHRLGEALALRHGPQDAAARREAALAAQEADRLGMALPAARRPPQSLPEGPRHSPVVTVQRRGRRWEIELDGRTALVDHSVGMGHLAVLLANPGQEIPAADLAAGPGLPATTPALAASPQSMLDGLAKRDYKRRLADLRHEIEQLEWMDEQERAAVLRAEFDWLVDELTVATGTSGRQRELAGPDERARIAVGKAIRRALARVAQADAVIGEELRATVQTGLRCSYRPA